AEFGGWQGDSTGSARLCYCPAGWRRSQIPAKLPALRSAVSQQRKRDEYSEDGVRSDPGAESTLESMLVPTGRPEDVPADGRLAKQAYQSGIALSGDEVGLADSLCEGGRLAERSAAGGRVDQPRNGARASAGNRGANRGGAGRRKAAPSFGTSRRRGR